MIVFEKIIKNKNYKALSKINVKILLYQHLNKTIPKSAILTQSFAKATIDTTNSLNNLKQFIKTLIHDSEKRDKGNRKKKS